MNHSAIPRFLTHRWRWAVLATLGTIALSALTFAAMTQRQSKVIRNRPIQANPAAVVQQATEDYDAIRSETGAIMRQLRGDLVRIEANRLIAEATKQTQNKGPAEAPHSCYGQGVDCGLAQFEGDAIAALEVALKRRNHDAAMAALLKIEALDVARAGAMPIAEPDWQVPIYALLKRATARNLHQQASPVGQMDAALSGREEAP